LNIVPMLPLALVFLLGVVSGVRTFTGPAVLWIMRHGGLWAYVLSAAAVFEYFYDVHPTAPPRTCTSNIVARLLSGAFVGWWGAVASGISAPSGATAGAVGALVGAYGSMAVRKRCITVMGNLPSGLLEDIAAIVAAVVIIIRL
jgi:uncharacterized membrane protein